MGTRQSLVQNLMPLISKPKKLGQREQSKKAWAFSPPSPAAKARTCLVSVIIPAHNEEGYLGNTLQALERQTYGAYEVIVIANGCSDNTATVARDHCHRLIVLSQKSLGVARNLGARMAKGDLLVFLDADTLLEPTGLESIVAEFKPNLAAGTVRGVPDVPILRYKAMYGLKNLVHRTSVHQGSSGVILCWKKHFIQTGGFDEGLEVRENSELIRRLIRFGKYRYLHKVKATTSMRRYDQRGFTRMIGLWVKVWLHSLFGDIHHRKYDTVR